GCEAVAAAQGREGVDEAQREIRDPGGPPARAPVDAARSRRQAGPEAGRPKRRVETESVAPGENRGSAPLVLRTKRRCAPGRANASPSRDGLAGAVRPRRRSRRPRAGQRVANRLSN
ncbi:MAG TPA: hypothetical protein VEL79_00575, partial [Vicinamibacterales bacterium]|nr:hypothetical protein [Vicinamibacterales bacterium]